MLRGSCLCRGVRYEISGPPDERPLRGLLGHRDARGARRLAGDGRRRVAGAALLPIRQLEQRRGEHARARRRGPRASRSPLRCARSRSRTARRSSRSGRRAPCTSRRGSRPEGRRMLGSPRSFAARSIASTTPASNTHGSSCSVGVTLTSQRRGGLARRGLDGVAEPLDRRGIGMAHVDREQDVARHRVGRVRRDEHAPDGEARDVGRIARELLQRVDDRDGVAHRVLAQPERRRAGVVGLAEDLDVEPAQALDAGDDADRSFPPSRAAVPARCAPRCTRPRAR